MSRFLILLPAPEAEWAQLPESEHEKGMRSHVQFHEDLKSGGHRLVVAAPLEPSTEATSMRPDGTGDATVSDGPFSEAEEQVVGFFLVETEDADGLVEACRQFAARGEHLEIRRLLG